MQLLRAVRHSTGLIHAPSSCMQLSTAHCHIIRVSLCRLGVLITLCLCTGRRRLVMPHKGSPLVPSGVYPAGCCGR